MRVVGVCLLAAVLAACGGDEQQRQQPVPQVRTGEVTAGTATRYFSTVGEVVAEDSVQLSPEVAGKIDEIPVTDGQQVEKGDPLLRLDSSTEEADLAAARATLSERQQELERQRKLFEDGFVAEAALERIRAQVEQAQAEVERARKALADRTVVAPFSGEVGFVQVSPGQYVAPGDTLLDLATDFDFRVRFTVPQNLEAALRRAERVRLRREEGGSETLEAPIVTVSTLAEAAVHGFEAEAALPTDADWNPGTFVTVELPTVTRPDALFVPEPAILRRVAAAYVFRLGSDSTVEQVSVETGVLQEGKVEVTGDIEVGDEIVVSGLQKISDGVKVRRAASAEGQAQPPQGSDAQSQGRGSSGAASGD